MVGLLLELRTTSEHWTAETVGAVTDESIERALPMVGRAVQTEWSGEVMDLLDAPALDLVPDAEPMPFQFPGMLVYEPVAKRLALCFGEGRWQDGFGPLTAYPVARIVTGLDRLHDFGHSLQFAGVQQVSFATTGSAPDADDDGADGADEGRPVEITLGTAQARGVLLERSSATLAGALADLLPLRGTATNTYASGPLTRFWDETGGDYGATTLDAAGDLGPAPRRSLATPGYVYYMPTAPHNGLRMAAREATVMKSALPGGGRSPLLPVVKLHGDWAALGDVATNLRYTGALPMTIRAAS